MSTIQSGHYLTHYKRGRAVRPDAYEAADLLRGLIEKIILRPDPDAANGHVIELYGELGAILSLCSDRDAANAKARSMATGYRQLTMVAGTGYVEEPTLDIAA